MNFDDQVAGWTEVFGWISRHLRDDSGSEGLVR